MGGKVFQVEKILDERDNKEYLIKWANFDNKDNTWESARSISHLKEVLDEWEKEKTENRQETSSGQAATTAEPCRKWMKRKFLDQGATTSKSIIKSEAINQLPTACSSSTVTEGETPRSSMENQRSAEPVAADVSVSDEDKVALILQRRLEECANLIFEDLGNHRNNVEDAAKELSLEQQLERQRQELEGEWGKEKRDLEDTIQRLEKEKNVLFEKLEQVMLELVRVSFKGVTNETLRINRMDRTEKEEAGEQLNNM